MLMWVPDSHNNILLKIFMTSIIDYWHDGHFWTKILTVWLTDFGAENQSFQNIFVSIESKRCLRSKKRTTKKFNDFVFRMAYIYQYLRLFSKKKITQINFRSTAHHRNSQGIDLRTAVHAQYCAVNGHPRWSLKKKKQRQSWTEREDAVNCDDAWRWKMGAALFLMPNCCRLDWKVLM